MTVMRIGNRHPLFPTLAVMLASLLCAVAPVSAGIMDGVSPGDNPSPVAVPESEKNVSVNEHLNASLPLDAWLTDENGKDVQLGSYFKNSRRPVLLQIGYFRCPMLCSQISRGLVDSLKEVKLNAGPDYDVVFVSIDPRETPALASQKKESFLKEYARDGSADGWHLLTGNKIQIDRITEAAGVEYKWVARAQQYSHPAVVVLCTPEGKVSRYLYGVKYDSQTLRLSLIEASEGKIGNTLDKFVLTCFQYDGKQGKYAMAAINLMKVGGVLTMLILGGVIMKVVRSETLRRRPVGGFDPVPPGKR